MQCVAQLSISSFKSKMYIHLIICTLHLEPRASRGKWLQKKLPWSSESDDTDRALVYSSLDVQRSCRILITSRDARTRCYDNYPTHWKLLHCNKENQSSRGEGDPSPY